MSVKMIGKNCKHNKLSTVSKKYYNNFRKRKYYYCYISGKRCGLNHTCDCFDDNGKLCFERKDK